MSFKFNPFTNSLDLVPIADPLITNKIINYDLTVPDNYVCFHRDPYFDVSGSLYVGSNAEFLVF